MLLKSREVLEDCREALKMLEVERDHKRWRVIWAGSVALVRSIGSVLDKVDGKENKEVKNISNALYADWNNLANGEHRIFREFIKEERNNLLKQYKTKVDTREHVPVEVIPEKAPDLSYGIPMIARFHLDENIYRPIKDGHWAGEDARDVMQEAIDWWEKQLAFIEAKVS